MCMYIYTCMYIWLFPKIGFFTPQIVHFNRVWNHYKPSILGVPLFLEASIYIYIFADVEFDHHGVFESVFSLFLGFGIGVSLGKNPR